MRSYTKFCLLALLIGEVLAQYDDYGGDYGGDYGYPDDGESTGSGTDGGGTGLLDFICL